MSPKPHSFAWSLAAAEIDHAQQVAFAQTQASQILASVVETSLDERGQAELQRTKEELARVVREFEEAHQQDRIVLSERVQKLRSMNNIRKAAELVLLVLGLLLLFTKGWIGFFLLLALFVARLIVKKNFTKKARQLAADSPLRVQWTVQEIGHPDTGLEDATGLCARADALYLGSLDKHEASMEQQRRLSNKQMAQMQAQHQAQMAQQQATMDQQRATMEAVLRENEATNDALYGSPGIIGQAIRTRDRIKRNQK